MAISRLNTAAAPYVVAKRLFFYAARDFL